MDKSVVFLLFSGRKRSCGCERVSLVVGKSLWGSGSDSGSAGGSLGGYQRLVKIEVPGSV